MGVDYEQAGDRIRFVDHGKGNVLPALPISFP